jgi:outer membrane receptor protein involved in Fe transport
LTNSRQFKAFTAIYATATFGVGTRVRVVPGVRVTWYDTPMNALVVDPRLRAAFDLGRTTTLRAGLGLYSQEPAITQQSPVFGNPNLAAERALHATVELVQQLPKNVEVSVSGFYKELWDRVTPSDRVRRLGNVIEDDREANTQRGRIYGGELLVRKQPDALPIIGWLSYTLLWSRIRDEPSGPVYNADFVQRHVLNAVLGLALPKRWRIGARFQLTSGAPYTPVAGAIVDASTGDYLAIPGARNREFLPLFHQLSFRIEKQWVWNWASATAYMDLQNVYNKQPVEGWAYGFDYRDRAAVGGLPIVPWIGARLDF